MNDSAEALEINGVRIEPTFAEAFDMKATRLVITASDAEWAEQAARAISGFGTSVIDCKLEIDLEQRLTAAETPDGRPGVSVLAFAMSADELQKQIVRRAGQCVLTCPTTALFGGLDPAVCPKRLALGKSLRYFGDGHQISKLFGGRRYWRIPVMDGEFICEHEVPRTDGIGGGNFLLIARDLESASRAARAAVSAIEPLADVVLPFPGGVTRSGSKIGSKYKSLVASTNDAFCPTLRGVTPSRLGAADNAVLEIVLDGLSEAAIAHAMRQGISAACVCCGGRGLHAVTAGNYGGKLGRHHFHLSELMS
ncbi:formylmethanofuran--tetrahydromethanopterin N-formyltransferase [Roseiconus nitratireducens]|uniref:Formylmethanofuran--tetrahydromethanopterin formyltransferase n=1 Tax=Roseiconus nitratireducens TaxID=2605748 RepID=A0A5M6DHX6_9BACT|nr:formylmethanofuran--tetrahydromethanopterin N-formyltransferase [Roseiconus nitratireducens]KAA5547157.1 formylmethanofuran--tetrahydromethanopterin N-formyltransferase [Roseiconus nitratireducens]